MWYQQLLQLWKPFSSKVSATAGTIQNSIMFLRHFSLHYYYCYRHTHRQYLPGLVGDIALLETTRPGGEARIKICIAVERCLLTLVFNQCIYVVCSHNKLTTVRVENFEVFLISRFSWVAAEHEN